MTPRSLAGGSLSALCAALIGCGDLETREHVVSWEIDDSAGRVAALRERVALPSEVEDAAFELHYVAGAMTPGPASLDACVLARVRKGDLEKWGAGFAAGDADDIDRSCVNRLAEHQSELRLGTALRVLEKPVVPAEPPDSQVVGIDAEHGLVYLRIIR